MSRTSLTRELALLVEAFDYGLEDLEAFQLNAAAGAFLPLEEREELIDLIADGFASWAPAQASSAWRASTICCMRGNSGCCASRPVTSAVSRSEEGRVGEACVRTRRS